MATGTKGRAKLRVPLAHIAQPTGHPAPRDRNQASPQMKHVVLRISSFFCFSLRRSAKVSMITPKMRFSTMMMTMKKNRRS